MPSKPLTRVCVFSGQELILATLFSVFGMLVPQDKDSWMFSSRQGAQSTKSFKDQTVNTLHNPSRYRRLAFF